MDAIVPSLVAGIVGGCTYTLLALGLVLINKSSGVLSFAHGEIGGFATFVVSSVVVSYGAPWPVGIFAGLATGAALGLAGQRVLHRSVRYGRLPLLVGTIALLALLVSLESRWFGGGRPFVPPIRGFVRLPSFLGSTPVSYLQLVVVGTVVGICGVLWLVIERTHLGLRIRATADDRSSARAVGLAPARVEAFTWALAGTLAAVAGVLLGWLSQSVAPGFLTVYLLGAFAAVILGGATSLPGAVAGGIAVGVAESFTRRYWGQTAGSSELVVFVLLFAVLLVRPQGLLSRTSAAAPDEESLVSLQPVVVHPRSRPRTLIGAGARVLPPLVLAGVVVLVVLAVADPTAYRLSIVPIYAIVALSLNSLMAGTGQVSLGHVALMGVGAFVTAVAASTWELPFVAALLVGVAASAAVALVLGVAALRVRGLHLAVLTMGFAIVLEAFVFPMDTFSNGGAGILLDRPTLGPIDLGDERTFLLFAVAMLALVWWSDRRLFAAPLGRAWVAVRDNERSALARGISAPRAKVAAFALSGAIAGLAGALLGYRQGLLTSTQFPFLLSITFLLYVVIGGIGVRLGVVAVTGLFAYVGTSTSGPSSSSEVFVLGGAIAVLFIVGRLPGGLGGLARDAFRHLVPAPPSPIAPPYEPTGPPRAVEASRPAQPTHPTVLDVQSLSVTFGGLAALHQVSVRVDEREIIAVIGPNGAGKTTFFNAISGVVTPDDGSVVLNGRPLDGLPPDRRAARGLARTFQQGGLFSSESVMTNLLIAQHLSLRTSSVASLGGIGAYQHRLERDRRRFATEVLRILGMTDERDVRAGSLPYGHQRVLELGCTLMARPSLVMLDEPVAGMSVDESAWIAEIIVGIRDQLGLSLLVIEHHVPLVKRVADRAYVLDMGTPIAEGRPEEVTTDPVVLAAYLGTKAPVGSVRPGVVIP